MFIDSRVKDLLDSGEAITVSCLICSRSMFKECQQRLVLLLFIPYSVVFSLQGFLSAAVAVEFPLPVPQKLFCFLRRGIIKVVTFSDYSLLVSSVHLY